MGGARGIGVCRGGMETTVLELQQKKKKRNLKKYSKPK